VHRVSIMHSMETTANRTKVFIVDDSVVIRERLVEMIQGLPETQVVGEAVSATDAVSGILHTHPDCVVLDLQLQNSSGLAVLREIHPILPDVVFMVLTNHGSTQHSRLCMAAGAQYFFDKSADVEQVLDVIAGIATKRRCH